MKELKVQPIRNGTVIDHIAPGHALRVLRVLGLPRPGSTSTVLAAMNVPTKKEDAAGHKDIVKIEDRELDETEVSKIALIAPQSTINIVRDYEVGRKDEVRLPDKVEGIMACPNANCVTNHEPVTPRFTVVSRDPVTLRCAFCDRDVRNVAEHVV